MSEHSYDPRVDLAEWLHGELVREYAGETEAWATERCARVMTRLNAERMDAEPKEAVILLLPRSRAFTTVGRYVYISRRLLERLPSDDEVAFVLAHEIAHHDCGHLDLYRGWSSWIPRSRATSYVAARLALMEHGMYSPEKEAQADLYALQLCLDAGYDGVFGPENLLDPTDPAHGSAAHEVQRWLWTRMRGYLPLRERRERVIAYVRKKQAARSI